MRRAGADAGTGSGPARRYAELEAPGAPDEHAGNGTSAAAKGLRAVEEERAPAPQRRCGPGVIGRIAGAFGPRFILAMYAVALSKAFFMAPFRFVLQYLLTDEPPDGFGLTASQVEPALAITLLPWVVKALYGIVSDTTPIRGYKRTPYLLGGLALGTLAYVLVAVTPAGFAPLTMTWLCVASLATAVNDVMLDTVVADAIIAQPAIASDLQCFYKASESATRIAFNLFKGALFSAHGFRGVFGVGVACALAGIPPVAAGWLGEKRSTTAQSHRCAALRTACCAPLTAKDNGARIFRLAQCLSALGTALALGMLHLQQIPWLPPLVAAPVCVAVCALLWRYERPTSRSLACVSMYTFLKFALQARPRAQRRFTIAPPAPTPFAPPLPQPNLVVLFKWYKATEENCNPTKPIAGLHPLPCFSPEFVGFLDVGAEVAFLAALRSDV